MKQKALSFIGHFSFNHLMMYFKKAIFVFSVCKFLILVYWLKFVIDSCSVQSLVLIVEQPKVLNFIELIELLLPELWFNYFFFQSHHSIFQVIDSKEQFYFRDQKFFFQHRHQPIEFSFEELRFHCKLFSINYSIFQFVKLIILDFIGHFSLNLQVDYFHSKAFVFFVCMFRILDYQLKVGFYID